MTEGTTNPKKKKICVKIYFNPESFADAAQEAVKAGIRPRVLQLYVQKDTAGKEMLANTDKIGKFLKFCMVYYKEHESDRMRENAEALAKFEAAKKEIEKRGLIS